MKIDFNEKELAILSQAVYNYIKFINEQEAEFEEIKKQRLERAKQKETATCFCCLQEDEKPKKPAPYYRSEEFCNSIREKIKMAQMSLPCEEQPERFNTRDYQSYIAGKGRMK